MIAAVIVFAPALILNFLQPVLERLIVKPDELHVERPYLEQNIAMTRRAYKLDGVDVKPFAGKGKLTMTSIQEDAPTIKNIRLWDPRPLLATYRQLQEIRLYYDFKDVDIDRYNIQNDYTEVLLSARELNVAQLPDNAQTWVNLHLKFTHGDGVAMSPVNAKDTEGLPILRQGYSGELERWGSDQSAWNILWRGAGQLLRRQCVNSRVRLPERHRQRVRVLQGLRRSADCGVLAAAVVQLHVPRCQSAGDADDRR